MRADRLISLLMLLQTRGRMTARQLAGELEVSERTIYRDIDSLSSSGIPVYAETGRAGGYALLEHYRTSLTGLTAGEIKALFMLSIPSPLADLGVSQELKAAMLKLSAALPVEHREDEQRVRQRIYIDSSSWERDSDPLPHLQILYQAVWHDQKVLLTYRPLPGVEIDQRVDPYALVAKVGTWYLVYARQNRLRVQRVSDLLMVQVSQTSFERPEAFDLVAFWEAWCTQQEQNRSLYTVILRLAPEVIPFLPMFLGDRVKTALAQVELPENGEWITLQLSFESLEEARSRLLGLGASVEVLQPKALRLSLIDYAAQITSMYAGS